MPIIDDHLMYYVEIPDLKPGEVYISHVGDGEYSFNVFGGAYDNLLKLLESVYKKFNCKPKDLAVVAYDQSVTNYFYFALDGSRIASFTVERLNPEEFFEGN